jgi:hypothetical protein
MGRLTQILLLAHKVSMNRPSLVFVVLPGKRRSHLADGYCASDLYVKLISFDWVQAS